MQGARGAGSFGGSRQFDPNHTGNTGCVAFEGIGVLLVVMTSLSGSLVRLATKQEFGTTDAH
jgi:hypothetical protein